ncbi:MAG: UDP-3-O-(3-hydroxymyristoyl)glucosamine N-acyltransferase [Candidatus Eremiobacteraeota bacterium]|nr:UDP-3-O-(3-hydroxymyristoyl)glucosamine N-acyltransferase [Candidatus Eremiobacteraeota bacterium]
MTLGEIAQRLGGTVRGDAAVRIEGIAAIDDVDAASLTFATDERYLRRAVGSRAAAVLTEPALADALGLRDGNRGAATHKPLVIVASARASLAALLAEREPPRPRAPYRHPSAVVDPSARIGPDVHVGALVCIGADASVGAGSVLSAGAIIGAGARLGRGCTVGERAMLLAGCIAGDRVVLQAAAVVGADGFGYVFLDGAFAKIPQVGNVVLGDDVEIGANSCIDRAQTGATMIGDGTKIDNLVQVGHNCRIGRHCAFAGLTAVAGSAVIGDHTIVGGVSAINGHITVGSRVTVAGNTMVWHDVADDAFISGQPAQDHKAELRRQVRIRNLDKLYERVSALERRP